MRTASAINSKGGRDAVSLKIAEQYVTAFGRLAQKGNTVLLPANVGDPAAMVTQALAVFDSIRRSQAQRPVGSASDAENDTDADDSAFEKLGGATGDAGSQEDGARFVPKPWDTDGPKGL